jgi:type II secretory pathway component PulJ
MRRRRFTLAEVLVALLVTAVVIPIALRALVTAASLRESAAWRRQALELADSKLRELVVSGDWTDAEDAGDFGEDGPGFVWELVTDTWSAGDITLRQLDLTVSGSARAGRAPVTLTTLVCEPGD